MQKKIFVILLFIGAIVLRAKAIENTYWTKSGNGFYKVEQQGIVVYELPSFQKTIVITQKQLTPAGQKEPLAVEDFFFSNNEKKILIYTNAKKVWRRKTRGDYWLYDIAAGTLKQLGKGMPASSLMFAKFSPDNNKVAYVSMHNIYVEDFTANTIKQLTKDGTARIINGTFDWAYEEEFDCRDGFRWSSDSKRIAYWQIDATEIRNFLMINNTDSIYSFTIPVEYPKVGEAPSFCRIGVADIGTTQTKWMQVQGEANQHYITRMEWALNTNEIVLQQLNRKQNESKIFICNATTGTTINIYNENSMAWIDTKSSWSSESTGWEWLKNGDAFVWVSEKDGWRHIYTVSRDGKNEKLITKGEYDIMNILLIDEKNGYVYFTASPDNATQQYLYRTKLDGTGDKELMTPEHQKGFHEYKISHGAMFAKHEFSNHSSARITNWISIPAYNTIIKTEGKKQNEEKQNEEKRGISFFQITTDDGVTMDGWMVKPKNFDSAKKYPVLFYVYSEPAGQTVKDIYGVAGTSLYAGDIQEDGYIQISLDGRGTPAPKGAAWRKAIYRNIGRLNIRDQAMAAKKIIQWPYVDASRIAVWGWSGGGSTTLNLLFQYPDIYTTGIAIAPVADQLTYDNIYQERYMGLPQENKEDFIEGSPISHAKNLKGNLLLIHGTGDDNVHYQNSEILINELIRHNKVFQFMSYPNRTHNISEGKGTVLHLANTFTTFLKKYCPGGGR